MSNLARSSSTSLPRPLLVTLVSLGVLIFSGWQWAAALAAVNLPDLVLILPKLYLISRSALSGLVSLVIAVGLFTGRQWAPRWATWIGLAMILWTLIERNIISPSEYAARTSIGFAFIALLLWSALLIGLHRPIVRDYFKENLA